MQQLQAKGASVLAACWTKVINETTALLSGRRAAYLAQNANASRRSRARSTDRWPRSSASTGSSWRWWGHDRRAKGSGARGRPGRETTAVRRCAEHGGLVVGAVLALTVVVGVVAFLIGRGVSTPAQQAARARPPAASLLTAPVVLTHARTTVVLRGTLTDSGAISVGVPGTCRVIWRS